MVSTCITTASAQPSGGYRSGKTAGRRQDHPGNTQARRSLLSLLLGFALSVLFVASPTALYAQEAEAPEEAVSAYETGREHYAAGRYEEAAVFMSRALELDPGSPVLVYNLARIYELQGELDTAIDYAEDYLALIGAGPEREDAERMLRRLEGAREYFAIRQSDEAPELRSIHETTVTVTERGVADGLFWGALTTAAVFGVAGGVTGGLAILNRNRANELEVGSQNEREDRQAMRTRSERLALVSDISIGVAAAAGVTALLLYFLRTKTSTTVDTQTVAAATSVGVAPQQDGAALSIQGTF